MQTENTKIQTNGTSHAKERTLHRLTYTPPVDIYESGEEILIVADVPGVSAEQVSVKFENDTLTLDAHRTDIGDVRYERTFRVPPGVDTDGVSAEAKNGTVVIHLPKSEKAKPRQIPVRSGR